MGADTFSPYIGMPLQGTGNNNNDWGVILNQSLDALERANRGNIVRPVTGGTLDLSGSPPPNALAQVLDFIQIFQGTLTANQIVIVPNISGHWKFVNETTGAFQLLLQTPSGTFINIPQGCSRGVTCDGAGNLLRDDRDQVGDFVYSSIVKGGMLQCSGQSLLKTDYPDLYSVIGATFGSVDSLHFTLPLLTDTGRFLRSSSGTLAVGTSQSNQFAAHTHTLTGAPTAGTLGTDSQGAHTHTATDSGHGHAGSTVPSQGTTQTGAGGQPGLGGNNTGVVNGTISIATGAANITVASAGAHIHNITGAPGIGTLANASAGSGTETRPEALVVVIAIRY
jgi:microcystin-dependent protein